MFLRATWISCAWWLASCGTQAVVAESATEVAPLASLAPEGELEVRPYERAAPSLQLRLRYPNREALLGYGGVAMWARPERDEIRVSAIVDAPADRARWASCRSAVLDVDGSRVELAAEYVGRPMERGVYDAVRIVLGVHDLRRMAHARRITGKVCGDPLELDDAQVRTIGRFVSWFDRIATPVQTEDAPAFREVGPKLDLLPCEHDDPGPYPA